MDWAFALEAPLEPSLEPPPSISDITLDAGLLESTTLDAEEGFITDIDDSTLIQSEVRIVYEDKH